MILLRRIDRLHCGMQELAIDARHHTHTFTHTSLPNPTVATRMQVSTAGPIVVDCMVGTPTAACWLDLWHARGVLWCSTGTTHSCWPAEAINTILRLAGRLVKPVQTGQQQSIRKATGCGTDGAKHNLLMRCITCYSQHPGGQKNPLQTALSHHTQYQENIVRAQLCAALVCMLHCVAQTCLYHARCTQYSPPATARILRCGNTKLSTAIHRQHACSTPATYCLVCSLLAWHHTAKHSNVCYTVSIHR